MEKEEKDSLFTNMIIPHLDAAYNLARWLARNEHDAKDIVQDSFVRAYSYFDRFSGANGKGWILAIVRNTFYTWHQKQGIRQSIEVTEVLSDDGILYGQTVDAEMETKDTQEVVRAAINSLPLEFREVILLREIEAMSYKEIAALMQVPIGTVMSRLARGRNMLRTLLQKQLLGKV